MGTHYPHVTIYDSEKSKNHTTARILAPFWVRVARNFITGMGAGAIILAGIVGILMIGPIGAEELRYWYRAHILRDPYILHPEVHAANLDEAERTLAVQAEANEFGVDSHFSVVIPKIGAYSNIIPNVDASKKSEYEDALLHGIAHAKGTHFPGQGKNIYLFSHSTDFDFNVARYNAVFYMLRKLNPGDEIIVYFADERYVYVVSESFVVSATETKWLTEGQSEETLFLQTCDPPGTTWKRLIVKAHKSGL